MVVEDRVGDVVAEGEIAAGAIDEVELKSWWFGGNWEAFGVMGMFQSAFVPAEVGVGVDTISSLLPSFSRSRFEGRGEAIFCPRTPQASTGK